VRGVDHRGRQEGTIVEVLARANETVVGRLHVEDGMAFVIPDNQRISQDILIPEHAQGEAVDGQIVVAEIVRQPDKRKQPMGQVREVLGEHHSLTLTAVRQLAMIHWSEGDFAQAQRRHRLALRGLKALLGPDDPKVEEVRQELTDALALIAERGGESPEPESASALEQLQANTQTTLPHTLS